MVVKLEDVLTSLKEIQGRFKKVKILISKERRSTDGIFFDEVLFARFIKRTDDEIMMESNEYMTPSEFPQFRTWCKRITYISENPLSWVIVKEGQTRYSTDRKVIKHMHSCVYCKALVADHRLTGFTFSQMPYGNPVNGWSGRFEYRRIAIVPKTAIDSGLFFGSYFFMQGHPNVICRLVPTILAAHPSGPGLTSDEILEINEYTLEENEDVSLREEIAETSEAQEDQ